MINISMMVHCRLPEGLPGHVWLLQINVLFLNGIAITSQLITLQIILQSDCTVHHCKKKTNKKPRKFNRVLHCEKLSV